MNKILFALLICVCAVAIAYGAQDVCCTASPGILPARLVKLAGQTALNCGHVHLHASADAANSCAEAALRDKKPFYVTYELQGMDSQTARGLALDAAGNMFEAEFDSMEFAPLTDRDRRMGTRLVDKGHIAVTPCPKPLQLLFFPRNKWLTCFQLPGHPGPLHK